MAQNKQTKEADTVSFIFLKSTVSRRGTIYSDSTQQKFLFDFVWQFVKAKILIQEKILMAAWALQNSKWDLIAKCFKNYPGFAEQGQLPDTEILPALEYGEIFYPCSISSTLVAMRNARAIKRDGQCLKIFT